MHPGAEAHEGACTERSRRYSHEEMAQTLRRASMPEEPRFELFDGVSECASIGPLAADHLDEHADAQGLTSALDRVEDDGSRIPLDLGEGVRSRREHPRKPSGDERILDQRAPPVEHPVPFDDGSVLRAQMGA